MVSRKLPFIRTSAVVVACCLLASHLPAADGLSNGFRHLAPASRLPEAASLVLKSRPAVAVPGVAPERQRWVLASLFSTLLRRMKREGGKEKPATAQADNFEAGVRSLFSPDRAAAITRLREPATAEPLIPAYVPNESYIYLQTRDVVQCMHELVANAQDTHLELCLRETFRDLPEEELRQKLKTIGRFGLGALQMFAEIENENQAIVIESRKRGTQELCTFIFYKHEGRLVFNSATAPAGDFPHGTRITVVKKLAAAEIEKRAASLRDTFHLNSRTAIELNIGGKPAPLFDGGDYHFLNGHDRPEISDEIATVRVAMSERGYRVADTGMGLAEPEVKEKMLIPKNADKGVVYETPAEQAQEVQVFYKDPAAADPTSGKAGVWLNGRRICEIPASGAAVCAEAHFVFPHNASTTEGWLKLEVDRVAVTAIKAMVDKLTDPKREIPAREALIQSLTALIKSLQPGEEHGAEENLMAYLREKTAAWVETLGEKIAVYPNEKDWRDAALPPGAVLISPKLIPPTEKLFAGKTQLAEEETKKLGLEGVRVYLAKFRDEATATLVRGADAAGKWILLDEEIWSKHKEHPEILKRRLGLIDDWPEMKGAAEEGRRGARERRQKSFWQRNDWLVRLAAIVAVIVSVAFGVSAWRARRAIADTDAPPSPVVPSPADPASVSSSTLSQPTSGAPVSPFVPNITVELDPEVFTPQPVTPPAPEPPAPLEPRVGPEHLRGIPVGVQPRSAADFFRGGQLLRTEWNGADHRPFENLSPAGPVRVEISGDTHLLGNAPFIKETFDQLNPDGTMTRCPSMSLQRIGRPISTVSMRTPEPVDFLGGEEIILPVPVDGFIDPESIQITDENGRNIPFIIVRDIFQNRIRLGRQGRRGTLSWSAVLYPQVSLYSEELHPLPDREREDFVRVFGPLFERHAGRRLEELRRAPDRERIEAIFDVFANCFAFDPESSLSHNGRSWSSTFEQRSRGSRLGVIGPAAARYFYLLARGLELAVFYHRAEIPIGNRLYADQAEHGFCSVMIDGRWGNWFEPTTLMPRIDELSRERQRPRPTRGLEGMFQAYDELGVGWNSESEELVNASRMINVRGISVVSCDPAVEPELAGPYYTQAFEFLGDGGGVFSGDMIVYAEEQDLIGTMRLRTQAPIWVQPGQVLALVNHCRGVIDPDSVRVTPLRDDVRGDFFLTHRDGTVSFFREGTVEIEWTVKVYRQLEIDFDSPGLPAMEQEDFNQYFGLVFKESTGKTVAQLRSASDNEKMRAIRRVMRHYFVHDAGTSVSWNGRSWSSLFYQAVRDRGRMEVVSNVAARYLLVLARGLGMRALYYRGWPLSRPRQFLLNDLPYDFCGIFVNGAVEFHDPMLFLPYVSNQPAATAENSNNRPPVPEGRRRVVPEGADRLRRPVDPPSPQPTPSPRPVDSTEPAPEPTPSPVNPQIEWRMPPRDPSRLLQARDETQSGWDAAVDHVGISAPESGAAERPALFDIEGDTHLLDGMGWILESWDQLDADGSFRGSDRLRRVPVGEPIGSVRVRTTRPIPLSDGQVIRLPVPWNGTWDNQATGGSELFAGTNKVRILLKGNHDFDVAIQLYRGVSWERLADRSLPDRELGDFERIFGPIFEQATGKTLGQLRAAPTAERLQAVKEVMRRHFIYNLGVSYRHNGRSWCSTFEELRDPEGKMRVVCNGTAAYFFICCEGLGLQAIYHRAEVPEGNRFYLDKPGHAFASVRVNGVWQPVETTALVPFERATPNPAPALNPPSQFGERGFNIRSFIVAALPFAMPFGNYILPLLLLWWAARRAARKNNVRLESRNPIRNIGWYLVFLSGKLDENRRLGIMALLLSAFTSAGFVFYWPAFIWHILQLNFPIANLYLPQLPSLIWGFVLMQIFFLPMRGLLLKISGGVKKFCAAVRRLFDPGVEAVELHDGIFAVNRHLRGMKGGPKTGLYLKGERVRRFWNGWWWPFKMELSQRHRCGDFEYAVISNYGFLRNVGNKWNKLIRIAPDGNRVNLNNLIFGEGSNFENVELVPFGGGLLAYGEVKGKWRAFFVWIKPDGSWKILEGIEFPSLKIEYCRFSNGAFAFCPSNLKEKSPLIYLSPEGEMRRLDQNLLREGESAFNHLKWIPGSRFLWGKVQRQDQKPALALIYVDEEGEAIRVEDHLLHQPGGKLNGEETLSAGPFPLVKVSIRDEKETVVRTFLLRKKELPRRLDRDFPNPGDAVEKIASSPDGKLVVCHVRNGDARRWVVARIEEGHLVVRELPGSETMASTAEAKFFGNKGVRVGALNYYINSSFAVHEAPPGISPEGFLGVAGKNIYSLSHPLVSGGRSCLMKFGEGDKIYSILDLALPFVPGLPDVAAYRRRTIPISPDEFVTVIEYKYSVYSVRNPAKFALLHVKEGGTPSLTMHSVPQGLELAAFNPLIEIKPEKIGDKIYFSIPLEKEDNLYWMLFALWEESLGPDYMNRRFALEGELVSQLDFQEEGGKEMAWVRVVNGAGFEIDRLFRDGKPYHYVDPQARFWRKFLRDVLVNFPFLHYFFRSPQGRFVSNLASQFLPWWRMVRQWRRIANWSPFHLGTAFKVDRHDIPDEVLAELDARLEDSNYDMEFFNLACRILELRPDDPLPILDRWERLPRELQDQMRGHLDKENFLKGMKDEEAFAKLSEEGQIYVRILQGHREFILLSEPEFKEEPELEAALQSSPAAAISGGTLAELVLAGNPKKEKKLPGEEGTPPGSLAELEARLPSVRANRWRLERERVRIRKTVTNQDKKSRLFIREWIQNARDAILEENARRAGKPGAAIRVRSYLRKRQGRAEWAFSIADPVGMDFSRIVKYLLNPDATTKRNGAALPEEFVADGFLGQGFFTGFTDCSEVRILTGDGGKVHEIRLQPIYDENENLEEIRVLAFREFHGKFKGSVVERIQYISRNPMKSGRGVRTLTLAQAMVEHAYSRGLLLKYCGAVGDVPIGWNGVAANEEMEVLAEESRLELKRGNLQIERVTINGLYVEDVAAVYLASPDIPAWLRNLVRKERLNLNFLKGTLPIRSRTSLHNPEQYQGRVRDLLFRWAARGYRDGKFSIPGLPGVEMFLERYDLYGPDKVSADLKPILAFKLDPKSPSLVEEQWKREEKRRREAEAKLAAQRAAEEARRPKTVEIDLARTDDPVAEAFVLTLNMLNGVLAGESAAPVRLCWDRETLRRRLAEFSEWVETGKPMSASSLDLIERRVEGNEARGTRLDRLLRAERFWETMRETARIKLGRKTDPLFQVWFERLSLDVPQVWKLQFGEEPWKRNLPPLYDVVTGKNGGHERLFRVVEGKTPAEAEAIRAWYVNQIAGLPGEEMLSIRFEPPSAFDQAV